MLLPNECPYFVRSASLFLNVNKVGNLPCVPRRLFFKWSSLKSKLFKPEKHEEEEKPFTGMDDENFSNLAKKAVLDFQVQKKGFGILMSECKKFYGEEVASKKFNNVGNFEIQDPRRSVNILYKFETQDDLKDFNVLTDSTYFAGYSSASLKLTSNETAVFSGNLCSDIPKTGDINLAGYASLQGPKQRKAFFRTKLYNWSEYTHLVLKIRGDGRTYIVNLHMPNYLQDFSYWQFTLPLYTRGGPYWQIAKMPLSHFYLVRKGRLSDISSGLSFLSNITHLSVTAGGYEGPFKLEIDYIGLEHKEYHNAESPYEEYKVKR